MIKMSEFQEMVNIIDRSTVTVFTFEYEGMKIKLEKHPAVQEQIQTKQISAPALNSPEEKEQMEKSADTEMIVSPMVGTFYIRAGEGEKPLVQVGSVVEKGQVVCVVEAMKLFNEVQADADGEIIEVLVKDGEVVEYGQPLFKLKKRT